MTKYRITIAVTGLNNIDSPGPGIPVIRALKDSKLFDVRIIGLAYETLEPGIYMHNLVDKSYQIPMPSKGIQMLSERLIEIHQKEKLDLIIPNFDAELYNFIRLSDRLKTEYKILTFLPDLEHFNRIQKSVLSEFGQKNGITVPFDKTIASVSEIPNLHKDFKYPIVIKGKYYDAYVATTPQQAMQYFHKISAKWGLPIIIQEFVSGNEVNVSAIGDGKGNCIGAVPMRKTYITDKGKAWAGISLADSELIAITKKVISKLSWKGGCELEFIKTDDGSYHLLEINPRFPAWVYLAVGCGQNHPEALVQMALGKEVKAFDKYDVGKMFIRYSYDQIVNLSEFEKIATTGEL